MTALYLAALNPNNKHVFEMIARSLYVETKLFNQVTADDAFPTLLMRVCYNKWVDMIQLVFSKTTIQNVKSLNQVYRDL